MKLDLIVTQDIRESTIASVNMLHVKGIAIPKNNDLIYRKRQIDNDWRIRFKILHEIHRTPGFKLRDMDSSKDIGIHRDALLLFGTNEELLDRLSLECKYLPKNQDPTKTNVYQLYIHLIHLHNRASKIKNEDEYIVTSSSILDGKIREVQDMIKRYSIPDVTRNWCKGKFVLKGDRVGPIWLAESIQKAEEFREYVQSIYESEEQLSRLSNNFMYTLGFIDPLPLPEGQESREKELLDSIMDTQDTITLHNKVTTIIKMEAEEEIHEELRSELQTEDEDQ